MDTLSYFRQERDKHAQAAKAIVDTADKEGRHLTEEELETVKGHKAKALEWGQKVEAEEKDAAVRQDIRNLSEALTVEPDSDGPAEKGSGKTLGEALIRSDGYRALIAEGIPSRKWSTPDVEVPLAVMGPKFVGAAGDPVLESNMQDAIFPQQLAILTTPGLLQERLTIADLFPSGTVTQGNTVQFLVGTVRNAPADAEVVESENKPGAEFDFDDDTKKLDKLAAFIPVSEEMLEDSEQIRNYINAQLPLMVRQAEEKKLANELYAAADSTAVAATIGGSNGFDAIAAGIEAVQTGAFEDPDALIIHPTDWWSLAVEKAVDSGNYFSGSPYQAAPQNPWGLRTVITSRVPQGFPLVGAFRRGGQVWRKGGVRVAASNSHEDYFRKNLVAIRAEERVALTVYYPEMFAIVDINS